MLPARYAFTMRRAEWVKLAMIGVLASATLVAPPAVADGANQLFQSGRSAYLEGRYERAIELFSKAFEKRPKPELIYNIGQAYEKLGDVPNALRSFREYLRLQPKAEDAPTVKKRIQIMEERLRQRGVQQVSVLSRPGGADIEVDGKTLGRTPWTGELTPGRHVVILRHAGYTDTRKEFMLASDRSLDIDVELEGERLPTSTTAQRADAHELDSAQRSIGIPTWIALGVGTAAMGAAGVFELSRRSAEQDARDARTQLAHQDRYASMESRQTTARVLAGVGGVGLVVGGTLLVLDLTQDSKPARQGKLPGVRLGASCFGSGCGGFAEGQF